MSTGNLPPLGLVQRGRLGCRVLQRQNKEVVHRVRRAAEQQVVSG